MPIYIQDEFKQLNNAVFPILDDNNTRGGHRTVDTVSAMNAIPLSYRKEGMTVYVKENAKKYILNSSSQWVDESVATSFTYNQVSASSVWTINHNLGFRPNITVFDSAGTKVYGDESHTDANNVVLTFSASFSGTAYLV